MKLNKIFRNASLFLIAWSFGVGAEDDTYQGAFLDRLKGTDVFDDAHITDSALVLWPSPSLQHTITYENLAQTLCGEHADAGFLVIWFMNSTEYRRTNSMELLVSHNCLEG
jgi:hypothetical protein